MLNQALVEPWKSPVVDYYLGNDRNLPTTSVTKGATLEKPEPVYPTQSTLAKFMLERITMSYEEQGIDLSTKFKSMDFQVSTYHLDSFSNFSCKFLNPNNVFQFKGVR